MSQSSEYSNGFLNLDFKSYQYQSILYTNQHSISYPQVNSCSSIDTSSNSLRKMKSWKIFAKLLGNWYMLYVAVTVNFLSFFAGMAAFWPSPVLAKLNGTDDNPLGKPITPSENDLLASVFSIGGAIGPISLIYAMDFFGRKFTMTLLAIIFPICQGILAFAKDINLYYVSRAFLGIAVSGTYSLVPVYLSEMATSNMRGTYVTLGTVFILTGGFICYCLAPYTPLVFYNSLIAALSLLYVPLFFFSCPETLYFTMQKHGVESTREILLKVRHNEERVSEELVLIEETVRSEKRGNILDVFRNKAGLKAFFICSFMLIFQQFIGITVVITYTQEIFADAKVTIAPEVCSIIICGVQTLCIFLTPVLMRSFDRKFLLTVSFTGICVANFFIGCFFEYTFLDDFKMLPLFALILFVISYTLGAGPIPWLFLGELYPLKVRSWGSALSNTIYWLIQFPLTYSFNKFDRGVSFLCFSVLSLISIIFIRLFVIETRGKTLQEIQKSLC